VLNRLSSFFDRLMQKYLPDPFLVTLGLTAVVFLLGVVSTSSGPMAMVRFWGDGFWNIIVFTIQIVMTLLGGYVVGVSPPVLSLLRSVASRVRTPNQAVVVCTLVACFASLLNWSLGLVVGAFICREIKKVLVRVNYRLLVASAYSGFILWHAGLSGSIPLVISTPGNFSEDAIGRVIPVSETLFSTFNITAVIILLITLPIMNCLMMGDGKSGKKEKSIKLEEDKPSRKFKASTPSEKLELSPWVSLCISFFGFFYIFLLFKDGEFSLNLNNLNFIFLFLGILLHGTPRSFIQAVVSGAGRVGPILIQYPFYAGIMSMMKDSGLAVQMSHLFVAVSNQDTFYLFTFYSAGLVNFFVPSGGGQWAVQAPVVIPAAQHFGVEVSRAAMAVAWGDAWTNLAQPFWALPLLAIAGLRVRDIMGYTVTALLVTGVILSF